jgi:hypothetical protein
MMEKTTKYRIYIDEVGNSDLKSSSNPNHRYLSLTGVIFDLDYIDRILHKDIENLKKKYLGSHPDDPIILHRKDMINRRYPFQALKDENVEDKFNTELLALFEKWEFTIISVLIDKKEHENKYSTWKFDPYHYCMEIIIERYYRFLLDRQSIGDVMFESRGGKEDTRLKRSFSTIYEKGTNYINGEEFNKIFSSKELKVKPKSANISGLQVADLLAFPSRKFIFDYYGLNQSDKVTFNDNIIEIIKPKYFKRGNKIEGYGFKILP